ncbi:MAG TPA: tetratricopeptide repeat protein [Bryobacteraceae bacterium]|nr:tetratricopeptide repeat protein [Bryobacteraceae bacterium]
MVLRSILVSALFFSNLIQLSAQIAHTQMKDPWDAIQYRQPAGVRDPLDNAGIRDFVINQTDLVPNQPSDRPINGTVSVSRLRHHVPARAQNELARSEREYQQGRVQSSIAHLRKAIAIDPDYMEAHNNLGARYIALGDNDRAIEQLEIALRLDPSSAFAHLNLSLAFYFLKRGNEAEQCARNAIRMAPEVPKAHYLLGLILEAEGKNTPEAVEHLEKSAVEFPKAHLLAARALVLHGAIAAAALEFRQYLEWPEAENREQIEQWLANNEQ